MHLSFIYEFLMLHFNVSQLSVWQGDWTLVVKVGDPDLNLVSSNDVAVPMWANDFILQCLRFLFSKMWLGDGDAHAQGQGRSKWQNLKQVCLFPTSLLFHSAGLPWYLERKIKRRARKLLRINGPNAFMIS